MWDSKSVKTHLRYKNIARIFAEFVQQETEIRQLVTNRDLVFETGHGSYTPTDRCEAHI